MPSHRERPRLATAQARTVSLTALAMVAFAANSVLCRMALAPGAIDAASFTALRLAAGAVVLAAVAAPHWRHSGWYAADWRAVAALFAYMALFSFAYRSLTAATGALVLFGAVQLTMFAAALAAGERLDRLATLGLAAAVGGLVYLVMPGLTAPDPLGAALMAGAGVAWGAYSLRGRGAGDPLRATATNFILALPAALALGLVAAADLHATPRGVALAVASGAVASGLGYVVWFAALRGLSASGAATVQLSVPVIAAAGGALLLAEHLTPRLAVSAALTLGGIALVLRQRRR
jgi:drug/metabolite transporter (DMT)-like permease